MPSISLVDLGSNSARLVVYEYAPGGVFWLVDEIREVIRLGSGVTRSGRLSDDAVQRAVTALRTFGDYARATGNPPLRIMATSAVRGADNRQEFVDLVRGQKLEIEVISGEQEAEQGVIAVANSTTLNDAWVVDLGGGSLQLSRMRDRRYVSGTAHPLGAIRTTEQFFHHDPPQREEIRRLEAFVDESLGGLVDEMRAGRLPLVAMGGTVRNLARAVQRRSDYPWRQMHGYFLSADALAGLVRRLAKQPAAKRSRTPGINSYRADIILAGAVVYARLLEKAGLDGMSISTYGMREGALLQELLPPPHLFDDVREFHVRNLSWRYPQPQAHTRRVVELASRLFSELAPLHRYGSAEASILEAAAELHDIGKAIHFRDHDRHGAYLLERYPMPGFDHREQALVALLVRNHRGDTPTLNPYASIMRRGDRRRLSQLSICLCLAEYLDRSRTGRVRDVRARIADDQVTLELVADDDPWVERRETSKQAPLFEAAFGRPLHLVVAAP